MKEKKKKRKKKERERERKKINKREQNSRVKQYIFKCLCALVIVL